MICENCQYYKETIIDGEYRFGECRRNSPIASYSDDVDHCKVCHVCWPTVRSDDWCGDGIRGIQVARFKVDQIMQF